MTTHTDAPADDLAGRLKNDARGAYLRRPWRGKGGLQRDLNAAVARIRSLEAQRDEAVGLLVRCRVGIEVLRTMLNSRKLTAGVEASDDLLSALRAFLDSLKEGRNG